MTHLRFLLLLFLVGAATYVQGQSDIYKKYAIHDELYVAYVAKFPLDSTTSVGVTLIKAQDSAGWAWMCKEFNLYSFPHPEELQDTTQKAVYTCLRDKADPTQDAPDLDGKVDFSKCCAFFASPANRSVCIFHISSEEENIKLLLYKINTITNGKTNHQINQ